MAPWLAHGVFAILAYEFNSERVSNLRRRVLSPWTGFYFLQSLLINLGLGYPFSLLYTVAFTAILLLLWRTVPRLQKGVIGICSLVAACYFPFAQTYGAPNFNTLLALHSTNMEESTEMLTIFPWYNYLIGVFIFALGVIALRRKKKQKKHAGINSTACVWCLAWPLSL